jgi:hypothetical protein
MAALAPDARTAVVTLTHDPKLDDPAIRAALDTRVFYLGCLGSTRTHAKRLDRLRAEGVPRPDRAHPCAGGAGHRGEKPGGDRAVDPGADHTGAEAGLMEFGTVPVDQAAGAILAHSLMLGGRRLRKGMLLGEAEVAALRAGGIAEVTVARLSPGDVPEDAAAARLAAALVPDPAAAGLGRTQAFTGRVNLNATGPGIVEMDVAAIHALNRIDPATPRMRWTRFGRSSSPSGGLPAGASIRSCLPARHIGGLRACGERGSAVPCPAAGAPSRGRGSAA